MQYQIRNRRELVHFANLLNLEYAVEVGVREGRYSKFILDNTNVKTLYAIDPWESNVELNTPEDAYQQCKDRLTPYGNRAIMLKAYSPDICLIFQDESFDFIYIDALHDYESVKKDINAWYPKLKKGGILAGHDYSTRWEGVMLAVNEFVSEVGLKLNLTGVGADDEEIEKDGFEPSWWLLKK